MSKQKGGPDGPTQQSDEELMHAYQQGNDSAFEILYRRHSAKVYGYLKGRLKDQAFADDVFQATFMKLHQKRSHYDSSFPFTPWLFTVCRSAMVDAIRKKKRIIEDLNAEAVEKATAEAGAEKPVLPDMSALPETQRQAVELRYSQELSFDEIAKRLETSPANVRQLLSRAMKKLKLLVSHEEAGREK